MRQARHNRPRTFLQVINLYYSLETRQRYNYQDRELLTAGDPFNMPASDLRREVVPHKETPQTSTLDDLRRRIVGGEFAIGIPAMIANPKFNDLLSCECDKRGMHGPMIWRQCADISGQEAARNLAALLLSGPADAPPDGMIIYDDNLVTHTTIGVADTGIDTTADLDIVAHCNFPHAPEAQVPLTRFGYDIRKVLETCLDLIDRRRRGDATTDHVLIEPLFEDELA